MSAPTPAPELPNITVEDSGVRVNGTPLFGPDHTKVPDVEPIKPPRKPAAEKKEDPLGSLGMNKPTRRPGLPKLTEDDKEHIADVYRMLAMPAMMFNQRLAGALMENADDCAQAWMELAEENVKIHRFIRAFGEGNVWFKLAAVHSPMFAAVVPEDAVPRWIDKLQGAVQRFRERRQVDDTEETA